MTKSELLARIYVLFGGRVAEEMIFGDVSTGAQNDLQKATEIARTMVTQFGMSERLGLVSLEGPRTPTFLNVAGQADKHYSEETASLIDEEIKKMLAEAHKKVRECLAAHRPALEGVARLLLEKEVVDRAELQRIIRETTAAGKGDGRGEAQPSLREGSANSVEGGSAAGGAPAQRQDS